MWFRQLKRFTQRLFKNTFLILLFLLDLVGLLVTYYSPITIPPWVLITILILAIFIGSFDIYRQGTTDISVIFILDNNPPFYWYAEELPNSSDVRVLRFEVAFFGHIVNAGPQVCVVENVDYTFGVNGVYDTFLLHRAFLEFGGPLHRIGHEKPPIKPASNTISPLVIQANGLQPFTVVFEFKISQLSEATLEMLNWLREINVSGRYTFRNHYTREVTTITQDITINADFIYNYFSQHNYLLQSQQPTQG